MRQNADSHKLADNTLADRVDSSFRPTTSNRRPNPTNVTDSTSIHSTAHSAVPFPWRRLVLLAFAVIAAITGILTALNRAGLPAFPQPKVLIAAHGALMVFGFLGTAIGMERGVAYKAGGTTSPRWGFLAPLFGGLGVISLYGLAFAPQLPEHWTAIPGILWAISMVFLSAVYIGIWRRQNSATLILQLMGAGTGAVSLILWACGWSATILAPSWMVFLVLTIIGERLELARISFRARAIMPLIMGSAITALIASFALLAIRDFYRLVGLAFAVMLAVMAVSDIARHTIRLHGFTKFMGWAMLLAYMWGLLGSLTWIVIPHTNLHAPWSTFALDCFDLGFVMSMVIAHAFIIIPAIVRRPVTWPHAMWIPLITLSVGLLIGLIGACTSSVVIGKVASAVEIIALLSLIATVMITYAHSSLQLRRQMSAR